ncbi:MAG TPA: geranylgeranyl reductase family protein, partial [Candidatus Hypogeohydataceae bacterium YC38]
MVNFRSARGGRKASAITHKQSLPQARNLKSFDVLVVGGGPTGSLAAYTLAKGGIDVAILEKEKVPRYKVCGGGLQGKSLRCLPFQVSEVVEREIFGMVFQLRLKNKFIRRYPLPISYNVNRERFDYLLLKHAQEAGAVLLQEAKVCSLEVSRDSVKVFTERETLGGRVIIGADGAHSVVRKAINPKGSMQGQMGIICELKRGENTSHVPEDIYIIDWGTVPGGYAWIFPKEGILTTGAMVPLVLSGSLKGYLQAFLRGQGLGMGGERVLAHPIPTRGPGETISTTWGLLAGDAAGLTDPFTGEGLYYALRSGEMAARWAGEFLKSGADLRGYEEEIEQKLMPEIIIAWKLRNFFNTFSGYAHNLYKKNDRLWCSFCEMLRGEITLEEGVRRTGIVTNLRNRPPQPIRGYIERFTAWYESRQIERFKRSKPPW